MEQINNNTTADEIDLRDIARILSKRKFWILGFVTVVCAITVLFVLKMDNIYESKAILRPVKNGTNQVASIAGINLGSGDVTPFNTMKAIIYDNEFLYSFVIKNKFEKFIIKNYDEQAKSKKYTDNAKFFIVNALSKNLSFVEDNKSKLITISLQNKDREFTKLFLDKILFELSNNYKTIEMKNIQERIDNYKNEIDRTNDITLKNKLAEVVSGFIQSKVLAQAQAYYGFDILVKPAVSDQLAKVKPKRSLICAAAFFLSFTLAVIFVISYESLYKLAKSE